MDTERSDAASIVPTLSLDSALQVDKFAPIKTHGNASVPSLYPEIHPVPQRDTNPPFENQSRVVLAIVGMRGTCLLPIEKTESISSKKCEQTTVHAKGLAWGSYSKDLDTREDN